MFFSEIYEKDTDLAFECSSNILNPYAIYPIKIEPDIALLLVFIRITYDCIHDDRSTATGCSGHLSK